MDTLAEKAKAHMLQAVVFDMDGLLVDSEPCWYQARRDMAAAVGKEWNEEDVRACMGVSTLEWVAYMIKRLDLDLSPAQVQQQMLDRLLALYQVRIPFLPGSVQAVQLAAAHFPTALASGSHQSLIDAVLRDPRLQGKFQVVVCSDDVPAGKPAPDVYLETAKQLELKPEDCVCLEDSGNGILAGCAAGMRVIAVPNPKYPPRPDILARADRVLNSLDEFSLELLEAL